MKFWLTGCQRIIYFRSLHIKERAYEPMKHANMCIKVKSSPLEVWLSKQCKGHISKLSRCKESQDIGDSTLETWNGSIKWNIQILFTKWNIFLTHHRKWMIDKPANKVSLTLEEASQITLCYKWYRMKSHN